PVRRSAAETVSGPEQDNPAGRHADEQSQPIQEILPLALLRSGHLLKGDEDPKQEDHNDEDHERAQPGEQDRLEAEGDTLAPTLAHEVTPERNEREEPDVEKVGRNVKTTRHHIDFPEQSFSEQNGHGASLLFLVIPYGGQGAAVYGGAEVAQRHQ